jgi:multicomponent Na+:H+ antiporter subunit G
METLGQIITIIAVVTGTAFSILGILGYIRLPDVYTRLHATGKVGIFGVVLLLIAAATWTPLGYGKAILLIFFLLLTGPVTTHALASAAYRLGIPMATSFRNDLDQLRKGPHPE